jgi:hypothetical protein
MFYFQNKLLMRMSELCLSVYIVTLIHNYAAI